LSILPSQCRAARALIEMDQAELARRAVVPRHVVADFENGSLIPSANDLAAIRAVLEADGVIFVAESDEGLGVSLRKARFSW
jgi:transcriptional regulator with XRE-family HTH domain